MNIDLKQYHVMMNMGYIQSIDNYFCRIIKDMKYTMSQQNYSLDRVEVASSVKFLLDERTKLQQAFPGQTLILVVDPAVATMFIDGPPDFVHVNAHIEFRGHAMVCLMERVGSTCFDVPHPKRVVEIEIPEPPQMTGFVFD